MRDIIDFIKFAAFTIAFIVFVLAILLTPLILIGTYFDKKACLGSDLVTRYSMITGCQVKTKIGYVPIDTYKVNKEDKD